MALLLDTHVLLWLATGDRRLSPAVLDRLSGPDGVPMVSAAIAWEYSDLHTRRRLPGSIEFEEMVRTYDLVLLDLPAEVGSAAKSLPDVHRDPVDRMLIAHALITELPIASADRRFSEYPITLIW